MPTISKYIESQEHLDKDFVGTIAFRNENIALPDGSKIALGLDDGHWVLVYQGKAGSNFKVYNFNQHENSIIVDQKPGGEEDKKQLRKLMQYFLTNAQVDDLVTILPTEASTAKDKNII